MKRFYKSVSTQQFDTGWQVTLDGRGLKTAKGTQQRVPCQAIAAGLAAEWEDQGEELDPTRFVLRDMADYAIDVVAPTPDAIADKVRAYGDTDTLLYRANPDEPLFARQQEVWEPIVSGFEQREGIKLTRVSGIIHQAQSEGAMAALRERLSDLEPFALTGVEMMTSLAASLVIGLSAAVVHSEAEAISLWNAASLEEDWQADLWGRDLEAEERRTKRQSGFLSAYAFVRQALTT